MPTKSKSKKLKKSKSTKAEFTTTALTLGDWSDDGHGQTATITISSNLKPTTLVNAFKAGMKKLGEKVPQSGWARGAYLPICEDFEDASVPAKFLKKLIAKGFDVETLEDGEILDADMGNCTVHTVDYSAIWLFIAKLGNPKLTYTVVEDATINIGGYGLFGS